MQISLNWVNELVNINTVDLNYLIEKLTLGGFEVEEILETEINGEKTITLDISATANRSDSLSIKGISKEIATLLNKPYKTSKYLSKNSTWEKQIDNIDFEIVEVEDYSNLLAISIENLSTFTSPTWLREKLSQSGLVPSNNLLDFQNYILLETGYPFEFYDLEKIQSKIKDSTFNLKLEKATNGEKFCANNDLTYNLNDSILTLKANDLPLSIGGIIPNKEFCYTDETKLLLVEASIFNSTKIRQQSRILGLRTDRSARYEKSLKSDFLVESLYQLISLLKITNPNLICKLHTSFKGKPQKLQVINLRYKTINEILGPIKGYTKVNSKYITPTMVNNYLTRLKFNYNFDDSKLIWKVEIPNSRSDDLTRQIDLIEEIGRLHGFNNFLTRLPKIKEIGTEDESYQTRKKLTSCLLNAGFNELIHYSLVNEMTFIENDIKLINPLLTDCSSLRSSLLPNLIKTVSENVKQGNSSINGFEYGHVFSGNVLTGWNETEYVGGIFGGTKTKMEWSEILKPLTWFEGKGKLELLFSQLNIVVNWKTYLDSNYNQILHPYRTAQLSLVNGKTLGIFGQIHPILSKKLNISSDLYLFELNFDFIKEEVKNNKLALYNDYSLYPKIIKDLSFVIEQTITFEEVQKTLYANGTKFLNEVNLLDEYKGTSIPENHISLCLELVFQSGERTLENKEVENILNQLQRLLKDSFKVQIRT
jgi:phenylalanyl-tRNA synthetase beta chain